MHVLLGKKIQNIWVFPKILAPQNGWFTKFTMETPTKMDDLGGNTPIFGNTHLFHSNDRIYSLILHLQLDPLDRRRAILTPPKVE